MNLGLGTDLNNFDIATLRQVPSMDDVLVQSIQMAAC